MLPLTARSPSTRLTAAGALACLTSANVLKPLTNILASVSRSRRTSMSWRATSRIPGT
jgi:hypothetical protein